MTNSTDFNPADGPDFAPLLGCWRNLDKSSKALLQMTLAAADMTTGNSTHRASYQLHVLACGDEGHALDWGLAPASVYVSLGGIPLGFHCQYQRNGFKTAIAVNLNKDVAVVQTYTSSLNGGPGFFSKEYFRRAIATNATGVTHDTNA